MSLTNFSSSLLRPSIKAQDSASFDDLFLEFINEQLGWSRSNSSESKSDFNISSSDGSELEGILNDYRDDASLFRSIILNIDVYVVPLVSSVFRTIMPIAV